MPRAPREIHPQATYHVVDHAIGMEPLFREDADRLAFLSILGCIARQHRWRCLAWCLMGNHVHLLVSAEAAELSPGMRRLKTAYALDLNRRHCRRGPLFRARFRSPPILDDDHLAEAGRYIVLNPVRAGLVARPEDWPWSSYRAMVGLVAAPCWLDRGEVLRSIPGDACGDLEAYRRYVVDGIVERIPDVRRWRRPGTGSPKNSRSQESGPSNKGPP